MLKQMKAMALVLLATGFAGISQAQSGLPLNIKKGDKFLLEYKQETSIRITAQNSDSAMYFTSENILGTVYEILAVNNNQYQVKASYVSLRFNSIPPAGAGNEPVHFDSDKPADMDGEIGESVKGVIGKSLIFTYDGAAKKLVKVDEDPGIEPQGSQGGPSVGLFFSNEAALRSFAPKLLGGDLPADAKIAVGYNWDQENANTNSGITTKFNRHSTITKLEAGKILLDVNQTVISNGSPEGSSVTIDSKSTATGKKVVDQTTGMLVNSKFDEKAIIQTDTEDGRHDTETTTVTTLTVKKV